MEFMRAAWDYPAEIYQVVSGM